MVRVGPGGLSTSLVLDSIVVVECDPLHCSVERSPASQGRASRVVRHGRLQPATGFTLGFCKTLDRMQEVETES